MYEIFLVDRSPAVQSRERCGILFWFNTRIQQAPPKTRKHNARAAWQVAGVAGAAAAQHNHQIVKLRESSEEWLATISRLLFWGDADNLIIPRCFYTSYLYDIAAARRFTHMMHDASAPPRPTPPSPETNTTLRENTFRTTASSSNIPYIYH